LYISRKKELKHFFFYNQMENFGDARSIAEKLTGKSRTNDDEISGTTLRLYQKVGGVQFKKLVLAEVEKLRETHQVGVETWRRGLETASRKEFDAKKRKLYNVLLTDLYNSQVKEIISAEELACLTLQNSDKGRLNWGNELDAVREFVQQTVVKMRELDEEIPESILNWLGVDRIQPPRAAKKRKTKK
jgi:hypothetical protein